MISIGYEAFSLTWPAFMQIYWNKRKRLHKKRVQLSQDWFRTPSWPPWRHVKTLYTHFIAMIGLSDCQTIASRWAIAQCRKQPHWIKYISQRKLFTCYVDGLISLPRKIRRFSTYSSLAGQTRTPAQIPRKYFVYLPLCRSLSNKQGMEQLFFSAGTKVNTYLNKAWTYK